MAPLSLSPLTQASLPRLPSPLQLQLPLVSAVANSTDTGIIVHRTTTTSLGRLTGITSAAIVATTKTTSSFATKATITVCFPTERITNMTAFSVDAAAGTAATPLVIPPPLSHLLLKLHGLSSSRRSWGSVCVWNTCARTTGYYAGLLTSAFMVGRLISSHYWGVVSDRFGCRLVMVVGLVTTVILSIAFGTTTMFTWAYIFR